MKAFEEVFQHDIDVPRYAAAKYWRAALEWVLRRSCLEDPQDMIKKELGEE